MTNVTLIAIVLLVATPAIGVGVAQDAAAPSPPGRMYSLTGGAAGTPLQPPTLSTTSIIDYLKAQAEFQKELASKYLSLATAIQQAMLSSTSGQRNAVLLQETALRAQCGDKATLAGIDNMDPHCELKPSTIPTTSTPAPAPTPAR